MDTRPSASYAFARQPKWIVRHVFILIVIVTTILLGIWQLNRLGERKDTNAEIVARSALPAAPVEELAAAGDDYGIGAYLRFRTATAVGEYLAGDEVLVRNRGLDAVPGSWVLTPLLLDSGDAVVVNRGWIPSSVSFDRALAEPPSGRVEVTGRVQATQRRTGIGVADPAEGVLEDLARADIERIDRQVDVDLLPIYLELTDEVAGTQADFPRPLPEPTLDEGPHLSYAGQWFLFGLVAAIGYPLLLRRTASSPKRSEADEGQPDQSG